MVKVLVFGATGFVGSAVARALRTQGHRVYGLARSAEKGKSLAKEEIIPVLGDAADTEKWSAAIEKIHVDVVIDCSGVYQGAMGILKTCAAISQKRIEKFGEGGTKVAKLGFVYLSGLWVQGDSKAYGNDLLPVGNNAAVKPAEIVAWRVEVENEVLRQSEVLNGIVLRAGLLFGGSGSFIGDLWWGPIHRAIENGDKKVELAAKSDTILGLVHKDDVGQAFVKAIEKIEIISQVSYPVFSMVACNESLAQMNDLAAQFLASSAGASSVPTVSYRSPSTALEEAMTSSSNISSDRTRDLLGWAPRHTSLLRDMEIFIESFKAAARGN